MEIVASDSIVISYVCNQHIFVAINATTRPILRGSLRILDLIDEAN
jgi:hypothetical protein